MLYKGCVCVGGNLTQISQRERKMVLRENPAASLHAFIPPELAIGCKGEIKFALGQKVVFFFLTQ